MSVYNGVQFVRMRLCEYCVLDSSGVPTGDQFRTQREMRQWIDSNQVNPTPTQPAPSSPAGVGFLFSGSNDDEAIHSDNHR
jgi:hypothetical protein